MKRKAYSSVKRHISLERICAQWSAHQQKRAVKMSGDNEIGMQKPVIKVGSQLPLPPLKDQTCALLDMVRATGPQKILNNPLRSVCISHC